jgi:hypothetical protein
MIQLFFSKFWLLPKAMLTILQKVKQMLILEKNSTFPTNTIMFFTGTGLAALMTAYKMVQSGKFQHKKLFYY